MVAMESIFWAAVWEATAVEPNVFNTPVRQISMAMMDIWNAIGKAIRSWEETSLQSAQSVFWKSRKQAPCI